MQGGKRYELHGVCGGKADAARKMREGRLRTGKIRAVPGRAQLHKVRTAIQEIFWQEEGGAA